MSNLSRLLNPTSVAVIGASADPRKTAGKPIAYLRKHGFLGQILPVNPKADNIDGLPCFRSVDALPTAPDVAMVMLGAAHVPQTLEALAAKGTGHAIVVASGFGETGQVGKARQDQINDARGSMRVLGPNTIGLVNVTDAISLCASGALEIDNLRSGPIALVSQSGGILGSVLSRGVAQGLGFSKLISTSNEADITVSDCINALVDDPATQVIALYLESIRDANVFRVACQKAHAAGKPIVAYKVGRSEAGARAAVSHTGAMAGDDAMYDAFFASTGVIRVLQYNDLIDVSAALLQSKTLAGPRIAVLTSTGGAGTLIADNLGANGLQTPAPGTLTAQALRALQEGEQAVLDRNPIDVTLAGLDPVLLRSIIRALLASDDYDGLIVVVGSSSLGRPTLVADAIAECAPESEKPILAFISPHAPMVLEVLRERQVAAFTTPEACANACLAMWQRSQFLGKLTQATAAVAPDAPVALSDELKQAHGTLDEWTSYQLLNQFGVQPVPCRPVFDESTARAAAQAFGGPVVLKVLDSGIAHKSDMGGVRLNLVADTIGSAVATMQQAIRDKLGRNPQGFLVQKQQAFELELIVGLKRDALGTCLLVGAGGLLTELTGDIASCMLDPDRPLTDESAKQLLQRLKIWPILCGYRGKPGLAIGGVIATLIGMDRLARQLGDCILEAEINPLLVGLEGEGAFAADALIVLRN